MQLVGIVLTVTGVTLASSVPASAAAAPKNPRGLLVTQRSRAAGAGLIEALGAMLVFGVCLLGVALSVAILGGTTTVFISKVADMVVLMLIALVGLLFHTLRSRGNRVAGGSAPWYVIRRPARPFWLWVIPVALLDTSANIAYNLGITVSLIAVVSVISSLFSAVTVLLAWVFLRERLARWQWAGVGAILVGIALVSV